MVKELNMETIDNEDLEAEYIELKEVKEAKTIYLNRMEAEIKEREKELNSERVTHLKNLKFPTKQACFIDKLDAIKNNKGSLFPMISDCFRKKLLVLMLTIVEREYQAISQIEQLKVL